MCATRLDVAVRDMPDDAAVRSNLASIDLVSGSVNYALSVEPFEPGVDHTTKYRLTVIDRTKSAHAVVRITDRAGNVAHDTAGYNATALSIDPSVMNFEQTSVGESSTRAGYLYAPFWQFASFDSIRLAEGTHGFSLVSPTGAVRIRGDGVVVSVRFDPPGYGTFSDTVILDDRCGMLRTVPLRAVVGVPKIEVTDVDFGEWPLGTPPTTRTFEIRNTSTDGGVLHVTGVALSPDSTFRVRSASLPLRLIAGEAHVVEVSFHPTNDKQYADSITFEHNAPPDPDNDSIVRFRGTGVTTSVVASSHDFGVVRNATVTREIIVSNPGPSPVTLIGIDSLVGDSSSFFFPDPSTYTLRTIPPGSSQSIPVTFDPPEWGTHDLSIYWRITPASGPVVSVLRAYGGTFTSAPFDERRSDARFVALSPNPVRHGELRVMYRSSGGPATLALIAADGTVRRQWSEPEGRTSSVIDVSGIPSGTYLVRLYVSGVFSSLPLVIVR